MRAFVSVLAVASACLVIDAGASASSRQVAPPAGSASQATASQAPASQAPVTLRRQPVAGEKVVSAFVLDHTLIAQRMSSRSGGDEQLSQDQLEIGGRSMWRFADDVRAVDGGRATHLRRMHEEASVHVDKRLQPAGAPPRALVLDGGSPLTNAGVVHRFVPARDACGKYYDGIETSEEFLPRLHTEMDLAGLLPNAPVAVGAQWTIEPARLVEVFSFGGLVPIRFAKGADALLVRTTALGVGGPLYEVFGGETTGTVGAELVAIEDGIARIALKLDVRAVKDQTALNQEKLTPPELYDGLVVASGRVEWAFRGQGELRWNVAAGRAQGLALAGAEEVRLALVLNGPGGQTGSDLALAGGLKLSIDVAVR